MPADLDHALRAFADPNRRSILSVVRGGGRPVGEIAQLVGLSQQTASHHLRVLKSAGLVGETRDGARHLFAMNLDGLSLVRSYLDEFWPTKLAALRDAVEESGNASADRTSGGAHG